MPAVFNTLYVDQGTNFNITISLDDNYGNSYNLNTYTVSSQIRKSYYSSTTTAVFATSIDSSNGTITLALSPSVTSNIAPGRYLYDTMLTETSSGSRMKILEGIVDVSPAVTR